MRVVEDVRHFALPRKNRQGNVVKVLREQYLRSDIICPFASCPSGCEDVRPFDVVPVLTSEVRTILVPDADTLLRYLELWEASSWHHILLLLSVLEDVRIVCVCVCVSFNPSFVSVLLYVGHFLTPTRFSTLAHQLQFNARSTARSYNILKKMIADPRRHIAVFDNLHFKQTFIERSRGTSLLQHARDCMYCQLHLRLHLFLFSFPSPPIPVAILRFSHTHHTCKPTTVFLVSYRCHSLHVLAIWSLAGDVRPQVCNR